MGQHVLQHNPVPASTVFSNFLEVMQCACHGAYVSTVFLVLLQQHHAASLGDLLLDPCGEAGLPEVDFA